MTSSTPESASSRSSTATSPPTARHALIYGIGSLIALVSGIVMLPVYTHALEPAQYGVLDTVLRFVNVCMVVAFLGLRQGYLRFTFDKPTDDWRKPLTSTTIAGVFLVSGAIMFPLLVIASLFASHTGFALLTPLNSAALAVWLAFEATYLLGLSFLQIRFRSRQFVIAQGARALSLVSLNFSFLHVFHLGLNGALIGNILASLVSGGTAGLALLRWSKLHLSMPVLRELVTFGLPYIPTAVFTYIITNADRLALIQFGIISSLGLLSLASKLGDMALSLLSNPIENVWVPFAFAVRDQSDGARRIGVLFTRYLSFCVLVGLTVSLAAPIAIQLLTTSRYEAAGDLVPIVAIGCIFSNIAGLADLGILMAKRTKLKPFITGFAAAAAVVMQVVLTPRFGVLGAVIATTLTGILLFGTTHWVARRFYSFELRPGHLMTIALGAVGGFALGRFLEWRIPGLAGGILGTLAGLGLYSLSLQVAGVITFKEVTGFGEQLLRRKRA